ncbi:P-loop containing nucleoside triphosphate hydrolase protein [Amanita muscaria]
MSQTAEPQHAFIVVMGVSGTGKSTLGAALARNLDLPYVEGDELHPKSNIDKMSAGTPLTDQDREPWLALIRKTAVNMTAQQHHTPNEKRPLAGVVIGCSALKRYYRDILRGKLKPDSSSVESSSRPPADHEQVDPTSVIPPSPSILPTYFVFISGPRSVLQKRMETRPGHFMKASMLDSQLATLECPLGEEGVVVVSLEDSTDVQVEKALDGLRKEGAGKNRY